MITTRKQEYELFFTLMSLYISIKRQKNEARFTLDLFQGFMNILFMVKSFLDVFTVFSRGIGYKQLVS